MAELESLFGSLIDPVYCAECREAAECEANETLDDPIAMELGVAPWSWCGTGRDLAAVQP